MSNPTMTTVESSLIHSLGYDVDGKMAYVRLTNGELYVFQGVPQSAYDALLDARSKGQYFNRSFKEIYPYQRG